MGKLEVKILQVGRGHTQGRHHRLAAEQKMLFAGDLVEYGATPYAGDAYYSDWPGRWTPRGARCREAGARAAATR